MATWVQSNISLGGYTFPAAMTVTGRDQPTTIDEVKIPYLDGTQAPVGSRGSKTITLEGSLGGAGSVDSTGAYITTSSQLETELNLLASYLASGFLPLTLNDITPARTILVQCSKFSAPPVEGTGRLQCDVTITLLAPDPRWLSVNVFSLAAARYINQAVTVNGSSLTYPVFTFSGAYNSPLIRVYPAGGSGSITLAMAYQMLSTDVLVVDCNPRNRTNGVLLNGAARLDLVSVTASSNLNGDASFFPYMRPGSNTVQLSDQFGVGSPGGIPSAATCSATYQEAYLF